MKHKSNLCEPHNASSLAGTNVTLSVNQSEEGSKELLAEIGESLRRFGDSKELLQKVLDTIPQAVFWKEANLNYLGCNQLFADLAGKSKPADLIGLNDFELPWGFEEAEFYRSCDRRVMKSNTAEIGIIESQLNADGELTWLETNKVPLHSDTGEVIGILGTYHDITRLKRVEELLQRDNEDLERRVIERTRELQFAAHHDGLTGLANRNYFFQQLDALLGENIDGKIALMFIDLDNFKPINDIDGHDAGDQLLIQVAKILQAAIGPQDFAGRFGGDEFLLLLRNIKSRDEPAQICEAICRQMSSELRINGRRTTVAASAGIVFCDPRDYGSSDDLVNDADLAMYAAKAKGKNTHCFFSSALRDSAGNKFDFKKQIEEGISKGQFLLDYQPIIDLSRNKVCGLEALVRWRHPEKGLISPADFIPIAESTGIIVQLGQQVIELACEQLAQWQRQIGHLMKDVKVQVNISARQLFQEDFIGTLRETVSRFKVDPRSLCLEITESLLLHDTDAAIKLLREVCKDGFQLYLDDFGTGYSSLNYLDELPVDALKVDRSFVGKLESDRSDNAIVRMIFALAEALNVRVIAEGVENEQQIEVLKTMNCKLVQGFYFARPLSPLDAMQYLIDHQTPDSFKHCRTQV